ncbi:HNH endonuclease [Tuberibacillus sp. Marseille-P3662]|uniref:HNH endonuclease n=1 Tax=Tuberibacillus sp. Marseille-P3662 TaxID=1965358 RepID=UPI000A1CEABC|nr:HNH endonuclease [Tuberibacillus sp. Marseille-P3662]
MKPYAKKFYKGKAWRQCRDAYFVSQHGLCERCGSPGKIVHHVIWLNPDNISDPDIALNHNNLELVCQWCHNVIHHGSNGITRNDVTFNINGELIKKD